MKTVYIDYFFFEKMLSICLRGKKRCFISNTTQTRFAKQCIKKYKRRCIHKIRIQRLVSRETFYTFIEELKLTLANLTLQIPSFSAYKM